MTIDAVVLWVDGTDKAHIEKLSTYCKQNEITRPITAAPTKYDQCGEIDYCIHSILRFAPWIRHIYIVTDAQIPPVVNQLRNTPAGKKLIMVDERSLFVGFEEHLPTFNCLAIESLLWRISSLSDRFIYFNDDWSIIRPVSPDHFFRDQKTVLRGSWKIQFHRKWLKWLRATPDIYRTIQEHSAVLAGWKRRFFNLPHAPLPVFKKTFVDFFQAHPNLLANNIRYPFRDHHQFLPLSLAQHLELKQQRAMIDNTLESVYINPACHKLRKIQARLASADQKERIAFACVQSMDQASPEVRDYIFKWLSKRIKE